MASDADAPVDLYIAAYPDPDAARGDWDAIKQLADDDVIKVDGLILVSRRTDGKIHVDDDFHTARKGAGWGAVGGAVIGLIFPPAILAGAAVGAAVGAGAGGLLSHAEKAVIKAGRGGHAAAQQLWHRRAVRGGMGGCHRQCTLEREQRHEGEGRQGQRGPGQGRGHEEPASYDWVAPNPARPCSGGLPVGDRPEHG